MDPPLSSTGSFTHPKLHPKLLSESKTLTVRPFKDQAKLEAWSYLRNIPK